MRAFTVNENDEGQRLDKFISKVVRGMPPSLMYKYIRKKRIKVNGKRTEEKYRLLLGDMVELYIPDEFFSVSAGTSEYRRACSDLDVVYEDKNLLLVNKRPGVLVHTGDEGDPSRSPEAERETLIFRIKSYLVSTGEYSPEDENSFSPALCNRIDRNTGGIVVAAKNAVALRAVNEAIRDREIHKYYLCAAHGIPTRREDTLHGYLVKNHKTNMVSVSKSPVRGAKEIVTGYRVIAENRREDLALLEISLLTGRTHQIRAHMASIGHPLLGDGKYGINGEDRKRGYKCQALCSYAVEFASHNKDLEYMYGRKLTVDPNSVFFLNKFPGVRL